MSSTAPAPATLIHGTQRVHKVFDTVTMAIGDTPMVKLHSITDGLQATVYAKLEYMNPAGSVKDRVAAQIIAQAERDGSLRPGGVIVEATSGNTGAGLAMIAALRGYRTIFVMPDKQSEEKRQALRAWGARVVVTPTNVQANDPRSYLSVARQIARDTPHAFYANQCYNDANPDAHYQSTGPELVAQLDGKLDVFVSGLGTGGTITGVGRYIKEHQPDTKVVGVDPVGSLYYDYFHTGQLTQPHAYVVEGIGEEFLPATMDFQYVDDVVRVNDKECFQATRRLAREEGIFTGGAGGAAVAGALKYLRRVDHPDLVAVVLLADSGNRYLSKIFEDNWMRENGFLDPDTGMGTVADMLDGYSEDRALITVAPSARVTEVIGVLKLHGVSQVPVVLDDKLVGILTEAHLLERALQGGRSNVAVESLVEANYCTVDRDTEVTVLTELFRRFKVAIVTSEDGVPQDIITKIDLIDYISRSSLGK